MSLQLGTQPQPDFDQPIELIKDCHRRIEYFFDILRKISELKGSSLDKSHREALEKSLHYFKFATPKHTQDEEDSVFARLRNSTTSEAIAAIKLIDTLEHQHKQANVIHTQIDALGNLWLKNDKLEEEYALQFYQLVEHLKFFYDQHIAIEENHVFPAAVSVLTDEQMSEVSQEMRDRRNLNPECKTSKSAKRRVSKIKQGKQVNS